MVFIRVFPSINKNRGQEISRVLNGSRVKKKKKVIKPQGERGKERERRDKRKGEELGRKRTRKEEIQSDLSSIRYSLNSQLV